MEKILIACSAANLKYEFPKRKWYQWNQYDRIAMMRLHSVLDEDLDEDIRLWVYERYGEKEFDSDFIRISDDQREFSYWIHPFYRRNVWSGMWKYFSQMLNRKEQLIVVDMGEPLLPEWLPDLVNDKNYLTIFTTNPVAYEEVLQRIEVENGLVGMLFTEYKEFARYIRRITGEVPAVVIAGKEKKDERFTEGENYDNFLEKIRGNLFYQIPQNSFFLDFCYDNDFFCPVSKKRMHFAYVSIPIFLDNIVKNRYNAVVNEGITFQVINRNIWRRKGNKDGRKEEYSDL